MTEYDPSTRPADDPSDTPATAVPSGTSVVSDVTPVPTSSPVPPTISPSSAGPPQPSDAGERSTKDRANDAADAGQQAASDVAQTATEKAKDVAGEAKSQARNVVGQAQDQMRTQAAIQQRSAVKNLRSLGDELSAMAERSDQSGPATDLVHRAGSQAHATASWLDEREPGQLVDELRTFARRKPGVFIAGALVAGVLAGRLTRGVVAAHQDDAADDDTTSAVSGPATSGQSPS